MFPRRVTLRRGADEPVDIVDLVWLPAPLARRTGRPQMQSIAVRRVGCFRASGGLRVMRRPERRGVHACNVTGRTITGGIALARRPRRFKADPRFAREVKALLDPNDKDFGTGRFFTPGGDSLSWGSSTNHFAVS